MSGITTDAVTDALEGAGLQFQVRGRYILTQCPTHDDKSPSAQIYTDDWFVNCHATCGRYHITKAFPQLKRLESPYKGAEKVSWENTQNQRQEPARAASVPKYKQFDLYDAWADMPPIPRDHVFKGIPLTVLDHMGWRWDKGGYFIPYFDENRRTVPFAQWRHLSGDRRFTFLHEAQPTVYGKWKLHPGGTYFIVEGPSDCAALEAAGIPWIGIASSSMGSLLKGLADWSLANGVNLVYAGDNDEAGDKLLEALDEVMGYRIKQPPKQYKDYGDMFAAEGAAAVYNWCSTVLPKQKEPPYWDGLTDVQKIQEVFPGAIELNIV